MISSNNSSRSLSFFSALIVATFFIGCGSTEFPVAPAKGVIATAEGKPLPSGIITFTPVASNSEGRSGKPAYGNISNGEFVMSTYGQEDGAVVGQHKVTLTEAWRPDEEHRDEKIPIPEKHRCELSPESTTVEIVAGNNELNLVAIPKKRDRREYEEDDD